jgi:hypothetical protein
MPTSRLTLFWTSSIGQKDISPFMLRAIDILSKYVIAMDCTPGYYPTPQFSLNWNDAIDCSYDPNSPDLAWIKGRQKSIALRQAIGAAFQDVRPWHLPIAFVKIVGGYGGWTFFDTGYWPWCIVDPTHANTGLNTIAHELGHAALLKHRDKYNKQSPNVMSYNGDATEFDQRQYTDICDAYFVNGSAPRQGWQDFVAD